MSIRDLGFRLDVSAAQSELAASRAWNLHRMRTEPKRSPHRECDDIWLRYNALENLGPTFNDPHESVWYPAAEELPATRGLVDQVLERTGHDILGGVLVTRIPAGRQVYRHADFGWHAEHYEKLAVLIEGNPEQPFCFDDAEHRCEVGDAFTFNNQAAHWVLNPTDEPRVTLIVCARRA